MAKTEVNNITLNYIKEGAGEALILLHGNGEDHHIFNELIEKLKNWFTVYAIDSRNHGESSQTGIFSYESMAEDIIQFIGKLGLTNVSLVGFSDGAIIGLTMVLRYGVVFDKMALLGVNLKPSDFKPEVYDSIAEEYERTGDPLQKLMLEQPNIDLHELKDINIPTLLIAGEDDIYVENTFQDIEQTMPNAQLKIMSGHDHGSYIVNNDLLYPDLVEFFK